MPERRRAPQTVLPLPGRVGMHVQATDRLGVESASRRVGQPVERAMARVGLVLVGAGDRAAQPHAVQFGAQGLQHPGLGRRQYPAALLPFAFGAPPPGGRLVERRDGGESHAPLALDPRRHGDDPPSILLLALSLRFSRPWSPCVSPLLSISGDVSSRTTRRGSRPARGPGAGSRSVPCPAPGATNRRSRA